MVSESILVLRLYPVGIFTGIALSCVGLMLVDESVESQEEDYPLT